MSAKSARALCCGAAVACTAVAAVARAQQPATRAAARDGAVPPLAPDAARAADAELRVALFDLLRGRAVDAAPHLAAAGRLAQAASASSGAERARLELARRVLSVESFAQLGLDSAWQQATEALLSEAAARQLAPALRLQLAAHALADGDAAVAVDVARRARGADESGGALALIAGLAAYQAGAFSEARAAFGVARQAGGDVAHHAAYADAVARVRADTSAARAVFDSLVALAARGGAAVGGQARLTAAQLAYQLERFEQAAALAAAVPSGGAAGADALLTQAWALYRGGEAVRAAAAFDDYATRYAVTPARDESRAMAAQALLLLGRSGDAARRFRAIADSSAAEAQALERGGPERWLAAARALVGSGDASRLLDPPRLKPLLVAGGRRLDGSVLAAAVHGDPLPRAPLARVETGTEPADEPRADVAGAGVARVIAAGSLAPPAADQRRALARATARLTIADAAARAARRGVELAVAGAERGAAAQAGLARALASERAALDAAGEQLVAVRVGVAQLDAVLDGAARPRRGAARGARASRPTIEAAGPVSAAGRGLLLDRRDSLRARLARAEASLNETRGSMNAASRALGPADGRSVEPTEVAAARVRLAAAERVRALAEGELVAAVRAELERRRDLLLATLRRDVEAAEFGSASAAFFVATGGDPRRPAQVVRPQPARVPAAAGRP